MTLLLPSMKAFPLYLNPPPSFWMYPALPNLHTPCTTHLMAGSPVCNDPTYCNTLLVLSSGKPAFLSAHRPGRFMHPKMHAPCCSGYANPQEMLDISTCSTVLRVQASTVANCVCHSVRSGCGSAISHRLTRLALFVRASSLPPSCFLRATL